MLTLFYDPECPYCAKVLKTGEELGIVFDKRNVEDRGVEDELIKCGGKPRVPFLWNEEEGVSIYESEAIIDYLHQRFG